MSRRKEKQKARQRRQRRKQDRSQRSGGAGGALHERLALDLRVRRPELARPPVYVDASGMRIPDPFERLGLDPATAPSADVVRASFREALERTSPEADADRARELLEARDLMVDPKRGLERALADLRVPNPEHFIPGYEAPETPSPARPRHEPVDWSARSRLIAIMTLHALLEDELESPGPSVKQPGLFGS